jgi:UDP-GlcNAc:undecaprenyl-phosphate/decaprenyl-phosphate GlcNAc-1-phosphate transferase
VRQGIESLVIVSACSFVTATLLTPAVARAAVARGWLDHPDGRRKRHAAPVPAVGGVAVLVAFGVGLALIQQLPVPLDPDTYGLTALLVPLFLATIMVAGVGLVDDVRRLSPFVKLAVQSAAAVLLFQSGFRIDHLSNPLGGELTLGVLALPVTLLWLVGMSNAFNLIDGLDGLAAGLAVVATLGLFVTAIYGGGWETATVTAALAGALLGFLPYNFNPARVFLGDCGSLPVGFVLAAIAVEHSIKTSAAVAVAVPLLAFALPILDALLALTRRLVRRRPVFEADHDHIHHRLLDLGLTPRRAVVTLYGVAALLALLALALVAGPARVVWIAGTIVLLLVAAGVRALGYWEITEFQQSFLSRLMPQPSPIGDIALRGLGQDLRRAGSFEAAWERLRETAWTLGFTELHLVPTASFAATRPERHDFAARAATAGRVAGPNASWSIPVEADGAVMGEVVARRPLEPLDFDPMRFLSLVRDVAARGNWVSVRSNPDGVKEESPWRAR